MSLKSNMVDKYLDYRRKGEVHEKAVRQTLMWARKAMMAYGASKESEVTRAGKEIDAEWKGKEVPQ
jgi:hypothetical protein